MESKTDCLRLIEPEIGGGRISKETIDSIEGQACPAIQISGLTQDTFEYFVERYGRQFREITFWKCPRVADLCPLETLDQVESLVIYWNQCAESLWDLRRNPKLTTLRYHDFSRLRTVRDVAASSTVTDLEFGDGIWPKLLLESLGPLAEMKQLCRLRFSSKKILDGKISPLASLTDLRELDFPLNQFSTAKIAWLTARLPAGLTSRPLAPYWRVHRQDEDAIPREDGRRIDTFIVGKGKPALDRNADAVRIREYVQRFNMLVGHFKAHPGVPEPE